MLKEDLRIRSSEGAEFDCLLVTPSSAEARPAIVIASAIHGVDDDIRGIAESFAGLGYVAAAPDLFWRTVPGALVRGDPRAAPRGQPRLEKIRTGERDLADVLAALRRQPSFNGRAVVMGFCYGGPYAILGPRRLGFHAGISCHGSQMLDFIGELDGAVRPVSVIWGDQDAMAPAPVLDAYRARSCGMKNLEVHVLPGVQHGYMMEGNAKAYDKGAYDFSMSHARALLESLQVPGLPPQCESDLNAS
jgi:carboxymethylenebutenolidase